MTAIYSADRERRLRLVLGVAMFTGVLLAGLAVFALFQDTDRARFAAVAASVGGVALLGSSGWALRALPARDRQAKVSAVVCGVVLVVVGFFFAASFVGWVIIVLGISVLTLALIRDDPELVT